MSYKQFLILDTYVVNEISPNVFWVNEPGIVSFYIFRHLRDALFIDSGLGINKESQAQLLSKLSIDSYNVVCTHAHCDHVGLNGGAKKCAISKIEWEKYIRLNESLQFPAFLRELNQSQKLELDHLNNNMPGFESWSATDFLEKDDVFDFGIWRFKVLSSPGHTCGSLMFYESTTNFLFSGDIIYDGKMYLHLRDSSFESFQDSISLICDIVDDHPGIKIWPAHNTIPLPLDFPRKVKNAIDKYLAGSIAPTGNWPKDSIFEEGRIFNFENVQFVVRSK